MTKEDHPVHVHLKGLGIETPMNWGSGVAPKPAYEAIKQHTYGILAYMNMNMSDDSLHNTPHRVAKMYTEELFYGLDYHNFPTATTVENRFGYDEMIACSASVMSVCEHHLVPFIGSCHFAYIPKTKILGLSKVNRIVDFFSRRPQIQERLTEQISATMSLLLETEDVAVWIRCEHLCVRLRGVKDQNSSTVTSKLRGRFTSNPVLRNEFLTLTK